MLGRLVWTAIRAYASRKEVSNLIEEVSLDRAGAQRNEEGRPELELQEECTVAMRSVAHAFGRTKVCRSKKRKRNEKRARKDDCP